jgi:hypothetical protein
LSPWGLEALAHHAESLLADVRSERQGFTPAIRDLLIESLDGIRLLRERGIVSGLDEPAPQALLHALEAALNPGANGENLHASAPEVPEGALHPDAETLRHFAEMLADCLPGLAVLAGASGLRDPISTCSWSRPRKWRSMALKPGCGRSPPPSIPLILNLLPPSLPPPNCAIFHTMR